MSSTSRMIRFTRACLLPALGSAAALAQSSQPSSAGSRASAWFRIQVVDEQTGRGVPLVELTTTANQRFVTDSAGNVAFCEPGLMDQPVFFTIASHGYEYPADGFGIRGVALTPAAGGNATIKIKRLNIAERLYRVTGGGIYRDSVLLGLPTPIEQPLLNAKVFGQDSVQNAIYQGKLLWIWGDTCRPAYPLGTFHAPGAISQLPEHGGLDPSVGVNLTYFVGDDGFARGLARVPEEGAMWLDSLTVFAAPGGEQLYCAFARVKSLAETLERGFMRWNDAATRFERVASFPLDTPCYPRGHPVWIESGGDRRVYFASPLPLTRTAGRVDAYLDVKQCETFTCTLPGGADKAKIDRDEQGRIRYAWRAGVPVFDPGVAKKLVDDGLIEPAESLIQSRDVETGKPILLHGGSTYWNAWRHRWVCIVVQSWGSSMLGEVWYLEADTPVGPWVYARKIVTHDKYSFYNPRHHVEFDQEGGRVVYFEGTYATTFSGACVATPLYDYNQIMYRLDLGDERLVLPVPIYDLSDGRGERFGTAGTARDARINAPPIAFFAADRAAAGLIAIYAATGGGLTASPPTGETKPVFWALPATTGLAREDLFAFTDAKGQPLFTACRNPFDPAIRFDLARERP